MTIKHYVIMKKVCFYLIRDNDSFGLRYRCASDVKDSVFYSPSLDSALDTAVNLLLNGSNSVTIENLGEHELKF